MPFPTPWKPTLDIGSANEPFFKEEPHKALEKGKVANVPILIGSNHDEGLIVTTNLLQYPEKAQFMM